MIQVNQSKMKRIYVLLAAVCVLGGPASSAWGDDPVSCNERGFCVGDQVTSMQRGYGSIIGIYPDGHLIVKYESDQYGRTKAAGTDQLDQTDGSDLALTGRSPNYKDPFSNPSVETVTFSVTESSDGILGSRATACGDNESAFGESRSMRSAYSRLREKVLQICDKNSLRDCRITVSTVTDSSSATRIGGGRICFGGCEFSPIYIPVPRSYVAGYSCTMQATVKAVRPPNSGKSEIRGAGSGAILSRDERVSNSAIKEISSDIGTASTRPDADPFNLSYRGN